MVGTVYTSNGDDTVSIIPYPDKARSRDMPGRTLRALIADMTGVKAAPERTICTGWLARTVQKPRAPNRRSNVRFRSHYGR